MKVLKALFLRWCHLTAKEFNFNETHQAVTVGEYIGPFCVEHYLIMCSCKRLFYKSPKLPLKMDPRHMCYYS